MKKIFTLLLAAFTCVTVLHAATLTGTCGPNLNWSLDTKAKVLTITGTGAMDFGDDGRPWDEYTEYIGTINFPEGITNIADYAFTECSELTSINIPNSVTVIGDYAFDHCEALTTAVIGNGVTYIGVHAFGYDISLSSVSFGSSLIGIGSYGFWSCRNLTSIVLPDGFLDIGDHVFASCDKLNTIVIPNSVINIGSSAFNGCTALSSVVLSNNLSSISDYLFYSCRNLISITIPNSVTSIGESAFQWCHKLSHVTIGSGVANIDNDAFYGCDRLHKLTVLATTPPSNAQYSELYHRNCALYVPAESVDIYADAYWWEEFASIRSLEQDNGFISTCEHGNYFIAGGGYNPDTETYYAVPGWCDGKLWQFNGCALDLIADNKFSKTFDLPAGFYQFKLTAYSNDNYQEEEWFGYDTYEMEEMDEIPECRKHIYFVMENYPSNENNNCSFRLREADQVKITYDCTERILRVERMHPSSIVYCDYSEYFIAGSGYDEEENEEIAIPGWCDGLFWQFNGCQLTAKEEGNFSKTFLLPAGTYEFKITAGEDTWFGTEDYETLVCDYQVEYLLPKNTSDGPENCTFSISQEDSVRVTYNCETKKVRVERLHIGEARTYLYYQEDVFSCDGDELLIHGKSYTLHEDAVVLDTVVSHTSLVDTIFAMYVHILPTYNMTVTATITAEELPYVWEGLTFTAAGSKSITRQTMYGCDSIVTLQLTVVPDGWDPEHPEEPGNFQLSLLVNNSDMGSVTGAGLYPQNTAVTIAAIATEGYHFVRWSDNNTSASRSVVLTADMELTAYFEANLYAITFTNFDGEILQQTNEPFGMLPVYAGATPQRPADAQYSYNFIGWQPEVVVVSGEATYVAQYESMPLALDSITITGYEDIADLAVGPMTHMIIEGTGHLTIAQPTTVASLTLIADSICGQVEGIENLNAGTVDMVLKLHAASGNISSRWFAFAVPFEVSVASGIRIDGAAAAAVYGQDFYLDEYNGALRAATQSGWQRVSATATLEPGYLYMIASAYATQWRFTAANPSNLSEPNNVAVSAYPSSLGDHHSGWNGIANPMWSKAYPQMNGINYATLYNNYYGLYEVIPMGECEASAAMPFFVQAPANGIVTFGQTASQGMAPMRVELSATTNLVYTFELSEINSSYTDKVYMTLNENKENHYLVGRDLEKMQMEEAPSVPQLWLEAYGMKLAAHDVPIVNNQSNVQFGLYAPQEGTYVLSMKDMPEYTTVYLTYNNQVIVNLADAPYNMELLQGNNANYGLLINYAPEESTGIMNVYEEKNADAQKILRDYQILIVRGDKTYTIMGQEW